MFSDWYSQDKVYTIISVMRSVEGYISDGIWWVVGWMVMLLRRGQVYGNTF